MPQRVLAEVIFNRHWWYRHYGISFDESFYFDPARRIRNDVRMRHSNCSVQMVSPKVYEESLLPYEQRLAEKLAPCGVHHCADNLHLYARSYARVPAVFFDVGWGSDVACCRKELPVAFLNLRLSPVRVLQSSAEEIR